jgi:tRNA pseudouridine65 synthase
MSLEFKILFQDCDYVAIDKPSGILVHPTPLSPRERVSCLTSLRDQLGAWLYPVHRLDRATSGVLLFAFTPEAARNLMTSWQERNVSKHYRAIVRGWIAEHGEVDRPLRETEDKPRVEAKSIYRRLETVEFPDPVGRYPSARYSLVEVQTLTGRYHQVRKHLFGISHPIIGDTCYGDGDHNRFFRSRFDIHRLLLSAHRTEFTHPRTGERVLLEAPVAEEFQRVFPAGQVIAGFCPTPF